MTSASRSRLGRHSADAESRCAAGGEGRRRRRGQAERLYRRRHDQPRDPAGGAGAAGTARPRPSIGSRRHGRVGHGVRSE